MVVSEEKCLQHCAHRSGQPISGIYLIGGLTAPRYCGGGSDRKGCPPLGPAHAVNWCGRARAFR